MNKLKHSLAALVLGLGLSGALEAHAKEPRSNTIVSGKLGVPGGVGMEYAYDFSNRSQVALGISSWLAVSELNVEGRYFFHRPSMDEFSWYVGAGAHALVAPLLFPFSAPGVSISVGLENRSYNGFTFGAGVGAMAIYAPPGSEGGEGFGGVIPMLSLRFGKN